MAAPSIKCSARLHPSGAFRPVGAPRDVVGHVADPTRRVFDSTPVRVRIGTAAVPAVRSPFLVLHPNHLLSSNRIGWLLELLSMYNLRLLFTQCQGNFIKNKPTEINQWAVR